MHTDNNLTVARLQHDIDNAIYKELGFAIDIKCYIWALENLANLFVKYGDIDTAKYI